MNGLAERNGGRIGLVALVVILLLGLGLRINEAWGGRAPVFDAAAYATIAANLDRGEGFTLGPDATQPASNYSPGLPLLAAGIYGVTNGVHARTARLVGAAGDACRSLHLSDRPPAFGTGGRSDRSGGDHDLPGLARVPGDADGRAVGGGVALGSSPGGVLGLGTKRLGERVLSWGRGACGRATVRPRPPAPTPPAREMAIARGSIRGAGPGAPGVPRRRLACELGCAREGDQG